MAIGPRDLDNNSAEVARRDTLTKQVVPLDGIETYVIDLLDDIQQNIFKKALKFREENTTKVDTFEEFKQVLDGKGGFILAHWDGTSETEEQIKAETKATIRCIPLDNQQEEGTCIYSGKPSKQRVLFARSY